MTGSGAAISTAIGTPPPFDPGPGHEGLCRRPASQCANSGGHSCCMSDLGQFVAYWGYPAIFVVVVLGNVGLPVPEETTLIVAGYLVWQGYFRLSIVLAVGGISAVAGDNIGYWLGRRYGPVAVARVARCAA